MGFTDLITAGKGISGRSINDYAELDVSHASDSGGEDPLVISATIRNQQDLISVKDALYDDTIVVVDTSAFRSDERELERTIDKLKEVAEEINGDIARKDDDEIIVSPVSNSIGRSRIGN